VQGFWQEALQEGPKKKKYQIRLRPPFVPKFHLGFGCLRAWAKTVRAMARLKAEYYLKRLIDQAQNRVYSTNGV